MDSNSFTFTPTFKKSMKKTKEKGEKIGVFSPIVKTSPTRSVYRRVSNAQYLRVIDCGEKNAK